MRSWNATFRDDSDGSLYPRALAICQKQRPQRTSPLRSAMDTEMIRLPYRRFAANVIYRPYWHTWPHVV